MATLTVREFIYQSYRLINASNPTVPLHGDDQKLELTIMNQLLQSYASTGLMLTIASTESCAVIDGQEEVVIGPADYSPTPDITAGRLANMQNAWLDLDGVTYPLIDKSRDVYFSAWKYDPLKGLPRFAIVLPDLDVVRIRLYPAPSQSFTFNIRGKFQLTSLTSNDDMSAVPQYYHLYFMYAIAREVAPFKGRSEAWTDKLETRYQELKDIMESASEVNLAIVGDEDTLLNGYWRVKAGI